MSWSSEERVFAIEAYFSNLLSVIATLRAFWNRFNVEPKDPVLDQKSIVTWVTTFRQTESTIWQKPEHLGPSYHLRTLRQWELQSGIPTTRRSAIKHASAVRLSNHSVWRILHCICHTERPSLPSLQDGDCAGTLRTWRTGFSLDVSLHFVKGLSFSL